MIQGILELVAVSAAAHLTGVVIYVVCFGYGYEEGAGHTLVLKLYTMKCWVLDIIRRGNFPVWRTLD